MLHVALAAAAALVTAVAMALATFTGRFVYPLLSLEGRRLWVLALAPWPRTRVVTAKFTFALLVGLPVSVALVVLSGFMLALAPGVVAYQAGIIACMAVGFSAGALGLGARLADYEEDNPAKLVAGYGALRARTLDAELLPCGSAGYKVSRLLLGKADLYVYFYQQGLRQTRAGGRFSQIRFDGSAE